MSYDPALALSRRAFLQGTLGVLAAAALPSWFTEEAIAAESARITAVPSTLPLLRNVVRVGTLVTGDAFLCRMGYPIVPQLLSDQEQLVVRPLSKELKPYEHSVYVRDLASQEVTCLDQVTAYYCRSFDADRHPPHIYASPDGRYLLWSTHSGTYIAARDGQFYHHWPGSLNHSRWMNDSLHWCLWESSCDEGEAFVDALQVHSLDPRDRNIRLPLAPESPLRLSYRRIGRAYVATQTHMLVTNWESSGWRPRQQPLQIMHLGYEPGASAVYEPAVPKGHTVTAMAFAPQGDAIAWVFVEEDSDAGQATDTIPENKECDYTLAISDAQGSALRTLGTIHSTRYPEGLGTPAFYLKGLADYWGATTYRPHHLQWVPNQQRLSFTFDNALWLVSTGAIE